MHHRVELDRTFLQRMRTSPRKALIELVWNALDADADEVKVIFEHQELGGVDRIMVVDDGHGMTVADATENFRRLGGSWKQQASETRGKKRALHGREGRGRFFAAALAGRTRWETIAPADDGNDRLTIIDVHSDKLDDVQIVDGGNTTRSRGTTVVLDSFAKPPSNVEGASAAEAMIAEFAVFLTKYPVEITYDDFAVDPHALQLSSESYSIDSLDGPALLDVIEWKKDLGRKLFLCNFDGTTLGDLQAGIQAAGFDFTAYMRWDGFAKDSTLSLAELGTGPTADAIEAARDQIRDHFRRRALDRRHEVIAEWKRELVYPYTGDAAGDVEKTSRELFDIVAFTAREAISGDRRTQRFTMHLLREALERDPGQLRRVLEEVLELDESKLADLSHLLDQTTLAVVVAAGRSIADRMDFLHALDELVFEPEVKKRTLERSQLHRMLATETWVLAEEFHLVADDESLTNVLRRHLRILGRDEIAAEPVTDEEGRTRIVDLMLAKSLENAQNRREHLVIELKAPSVKLGHKELNQIRDYATAVADDPQFDKSSTTWDFWVISTDVADPVRRQLSQRNRELGLIDEYSDINVRIWAKTWGQVITDARHRLKFVRSQLEYNSGRDKGIRYLHERHRDYVPDPLRQSDT